jgi:hypothetical protein
MRDDQPRVRSPLFDEGMKVVSVGPEDRTSAAAPDRVRCFDCGGTEWVIDRTYVWKRDADGRPPLVNATTWKCVGCGRHRRSKTWAA